MEYCPGSLQARFLLRHMWKVKGKGQDAMCAPAGEQSTGWRQRPHAARTGRSQRSIRVLQSSKLQCRVGCCTSSLQSTVAPLHPRGHRPGSDAACGCPHCPGTPPIGLLTLFSVHLRV